MMGTTLLHCCPRHRPAQYSPWAAARPWPAPGRSGDSGGAAGLYVRSHRPDAEHHLLQNLVHGAAPRLHRRRCFTRRRSGRPLPAGRGQGSRSGQVVPQPWGTAVAAPSWAARRCERVTTAAAPCVPQRKASSARKAGGMSLTAFYICYISE